VHFSAKSADTVVMLQRRLERSKFSFFLVGPRGTGKSTWEEDRGHRSQSRSRRPPRDLRGLRAIAELPGLARRILVFLGPQPLATSDGIDAWPLSHFSQMLAKGALWP
jgi:hypothetical protein